MHTRVLFSLLIIFSLILTGCWRDSVQEDLLNYINEELPPLADLEFKVIQKYESVTGDNYKNDFVLYEALSEEIVPTYRKFIEGLEEIRPRTREVRELHEIFIDAANIQYNAFIQAMSAIEQADTSLVVDTNQKLTESRRKIREWQTRLLELGKKHNVEINLP